MHRPSRIPQPSRRLAGALAAVLVLLSAGAGGVPRPWGEAGHRLTARAALGSLPTDMPRFFRRAAEQLEYLNPEPDRWRDRELAAMDRGFSYDHYIDLENVPARALEAPDRWEYVRRLYASGVKRPERDAGFLPYRIDELYERLLTEWRLWRKATGPERRWIEQRVVNDAGLLGHYVADGSQPHHTTIHFNGWSEGAPNPHGYSTARDLHYRFESAFVQAYITNAEVLGASPGEPAQRVTDVPGAVLDYLLDSNRQVERLYRLEQQARFDAEGPAPASHRRFVAERLAAGASMLRDLWWTAWIESARPRSPGS